MVKEKESVENKVQELNTNRVYVDLDSEDKLQILSKTLEENKTFVLVKIGVKTNPGFKCEKKAVEEMYKFRELAIEQANKKMIDINVIETYKDDSFCYDAKLFISKKTF